MPKIKGKILFHEIYIRDRTKHLTQVESSKRFFLLSVCIFQFHCGGTIDGALYGLKGTQSNTLCSGVLDNFFPTGTYTGLSTSVSSLKHVKKSTMKKKYYWVAVNLKC